MQKKLKVLLHLQHNVELRYLTLVSGSLVP
jgi:hypothetical protein